MKQAISDTILDELINYWSQFYIKNDFNPFVSNNLKALLELKQRRELDLLKKGINKT